MAATTWHPRTTINPKSWLLTNGEVVTEPPLEETASGRKVRVAGTSISAFTKDIDELLFQGVQAVASQKGVKVWMPLDDAKRHEAEHGFFGNRTKKGHKAALHLLKANTSYGSATTVWWRFRHPSLPIEALLVVDMTTAYAYRGQPSNQDMRLSLVMQSTNPDDAATVNVVVSQESDMSGFWGRMRSADHRLRFQELLRDNPPNWYSDFRLRQESVTGDRVAVKQMLTHIEAIDGFDKIDVPDLRDLDKPAWLTLDLIDTNLTGEFVQSLKDYLDGEGVVAEVKKHYDEMVRLLRSTGLVLPEKDEASFGSALAGGEPVTIEIQSKPAEVGHQVDHAHSVVLHLPTGTMIVNCANSAQVNNNEIAHKWEEALTMASLTGQEDVLLAYARRFAETANDRRAKKILDERKTQ